MSSASRYLLRKRKQIYDRMIRVDHAGEFGADRIYAGQMAALRRASPEKAKVVQELWDQEKAHLREFEYLLLKHRGRKSFLTPIWSAAGFALGYGSALIGHEAAMACTVAIEKVIADHYNAQIRELAADDLHAHKPLISVFSNFRDDEQHHHDTGLAHEAEKAPLYPTMSFVVENISKLAIKIAEKV
ncbi:hypothetical protein B4U79_06084 [Dinothrombium tinctorium]|uniref:5-demethoxyubiquinone hydroxylase, mitochondrial n=1 Tax=Dinothrombium tinctorium TaxID=1965070 RepID=A0A3S3NEK6_9ACAR|nr:hypothetical protein B4U79_06084 [Dinothrombium tinctorium]